MSQDANEEVELPFESVGEKLVRKRRELGLDRAAVSALTRIPERHLAAIEAGDYAALPARAYAVGFTRSYAKAVGLDERAIAQEVRIELAALDANATTPTLLAFEPGDPARVPGSRFAWLTALGVAAVLLVCFGLWRGHFFPGGELPSILPADKPAVVAAPAAPAPTPAIAPVGGAVIFTAQQDRVWVKFYDATGTQLLQKVLALGESYTVPEALADVKLDTARPDALAITIGGRAVPKLADQQMVMKNVSVTAKALLARPPIVAPATQPAPRPTTVPVVPPAVVIPAPAAT